MWDRLGYQTPVSLCSTLTSSDKKSPFCSFCAPCSALVKDPLLDIPPQLITKALLENEEELSAFSLTGAASLWAPVCGRPTSSDKKHIYIGILTVLTSADKFTVSATRISGQIPLISWCIWSNSWWHIWVSLNPVDISCQSSFRVGNSVQCAVH